jgi:DNA-binding PadR family transcriptional regulator
MNERRLGNAAVQVLGAVARGVSYGFDIMDDVGLKSGTVYRALSRLEELGLVRAKWEAAAHAVEEKRPRRRYYELTAEGARELESVRQRLRGIVAGLRTEQR